MEYDTFINEMATFCTKLSANFSTEVLNKAITAFIRFKDCSNIINLRHNELIKAENQLAAIRPEDATPLKLVQLDYVNKTESFHQQIYVGISAFIMLLNHIVKLEMPRNSVEKFLKFLDRELNFTHSEAIKVLNDSRFFRAKFIDHIQQHVVHDWMTWDYETGVTVIYFIRTGDRVFTPTVFDPYSPNFVLPVDHKSFYVAPKHYEVNNAYSQVVYETFRHFASKYTKV